MENNMQRAFLWTIIWISVVISQTTVNPDISVLGDLIVETDGEHTTLSNSGIELALQGYVNPFARADVFLHKHNGEEPAELEEAFLSIERGLPLNLGLRTGKLRPDLGRINKEHFHTYYYILPSHPVQSMLGQEMWAGTGLEANVLVPLPWYSRISMGYFQNGISLHHHHEDGAILEGGDDHAHVEEEGVAPALITRVSNFFNFTTVTHMELGVSHYREISEQDVIITAADFKLKWRPDTYRSLSWQGEFFYKGLIEHSEKLNENEHQTETEPIKVAYSWFNYQFNRIWNVGAIVDFSSSLDDEEYKSIGLFFGFSPVEESSVFRVRIHLEYHGNDEPQFSVVTQAIWSLGPHKPHRY